MTDGKKENTQNTVGKEIEIKINDSVRLIMTIQDKMDPTAFLEMVSSLKKIVQIHAPIASIPRQRKATAEQVEADKKEITKYTKEGFNSVDISQKMARKPEYVYRLKTILRTEGKIK